MIGIGRPTLYDDTGLDRSNWHVKNDCPEFTVNVVEITMELKEDGDDTGIILARDEREND